MADVFMHLDAKVLLRNKHILFLGDSNIRAQYKDLTWLLHFNSLISAKSLKGKLEPSFLGDKLLDRSKLHYGRDFKEKRLYHDHSNGTVLEFEFLTRAYSLQLRKLFNEYKRNPKLVPDVVVINSCLWDLTRWGPNGVPEYKDNMVKLMRLLSDCLPKKCLVIWSTALPTAPHIKGALIIKQIQSIQPMMRFEVMEANTFAREVVVSHGFDVLDNHFHTRMQMHRRAKDGVHYLPVPVRFMTNLLLTHIALSWGKRLPNNVMSILLNKAMQMDSNDTEKRADVKVPTFGIFSKINLVSPVVPRTRGITITFNPDRGSRRCNIFDDEDSVASTSSSGMRSVVQIPQKHQQRHASAKPYRPKKYKNNRNRNHPYDQTDYHNSCRSFYNPFPIGIYSSYDPYPINEDDDDPREDYYDEDYN